MPLLFSKTYDPMDPSAHMAHQIVTLSSSMACDVKVKVCAVIKDDFVMECTLKW